MAHFLGDDPVVLALALALLVTGAIAAISGYHHFRQVEHAIRSGDPMPRGPAADLLSLTMLVCLALAAAYVVTQLVG